MKRILLYAPNKKKASQLVFLLGLVDIRCTVVDEIEEVYNWVSTDQQKQLKFDLLLLESVKDNEIEKKLLPQIASIITTQIVCIGQEGDLFPPYVYQNTKVCEMQNILEYVKEHLGLNDSVIKRTNRYSHAANNYAQRQQHS